MFETRINLSKGARTQKGWAHEITLGCVADAIDIPLRRVLRERELLPAAGALWSHIESELNATEKHVLASHEGMSFVRNSSELQRLADLASKSGRDVEIVVVVRDEQKWLDSMRWKLGQIGFESGSETGGSPLDPFSDLWLLDRDRMLAAYSQTFGPEKITVIDYDLVRFREESVVGALWQALGLPMSATLTGTEFWLNSRGRTPGGHRNCDTDRRPQGG